VKAPQVGEIVTLAYIDPDERAQAVGGQQRRHDAHQQQEQRQAGTTRPQRDSLLTPRDE
jgi:hypothetical protein